MLGLTRVGVKRGQGREMGVEQAERTLAVSVKQAAMRVQEGEGSK